MANIVITKTVRVNGVPTDASAVVLRDATNTYGVRRRDTLEVIAAPGTVMPKVGTGVYEYIITNAESGVPYDYVVEVTLNGAVYRLVDQATTGETLDTDGMWLTDTILERYIGKDNRDFLADRDNDANATKLSAAKRLAILSAEDQARRILSRRYVIPISPMSSADLFTLQRLTVRIAIYELWRGRGQYVNAANQQTENPYQRARDDALVELDMMSRDGAEVGLGATELDGWGGATVGAFVFVPLRSGSLSG